jgi:hypothetical protein
MCLTNHYESLMTKLMVVRDRVRGVYWGESTGLYLHGRPGTSKTYTVRSTLDTLGANFEPSSGHLTPIALFDLIAENRDRIIVLDDVAAIFRQPIALQILLAALGSPHDATRARIVQYKTAIETREVPFSGGIICLSNLALDGHHHEVLAALRDRVHVLSYEPTDEEIIALICKLADEGVDGVPPEKARMVATYLIQECKAREIRPSVRLFVDKAIGDYRLHAAGKCETHWRDLIASELEQQLVEPQYPTTDVSREEQSEAELRVALDIYLSFETRAERSEQWKCRTNKSEKAFYRRVGQLRRAGRLPGGDHRLAH